MGEMGFAEGGFFMSKILDWIKKHVWQTILIVLGLFFLPLLLVHIAYRISAISPWFASTWEAGELITYIAGFEAFLGTVLLGMIAINQNTNAIEVNSRILKIEEKSSYLSRCPNIEVIPKEFVLKELGDIYEIEDPVFCEKNLFSKLNLKPTNWKDSFFIGTIAFINHTAFNITVELQTLVIDSEINDKVEPFLDFIPLPYRQSILHISTSNEKVICFVLNIDASNESIDRRGTMSFLVRNNVSDEFVYKVTFILFVQKDATKGSLFITNFTHEKVNFDN